LCLVEGIPVLQMQASFLLRYGHGQSPLANWVKLIINAYQCD
jgi:hypothetical protein